MTAKAFDITVRWRAKQPQRWTKRHMTRAGTIKTLCGMWIPKSAELAAPLDSAADSCGKCYRLVTHDRDNL